MALHDFECLRCGHVEADVNIPIAIGATGTPVPCPVCAAVGLSTLMAWIPQTRAMDVGGVKGAAFKAFETYDGRNQKVMVSNMRDLRRIERESEQLYKNGEGQPIVFRAFSNNRSNKDQSALHPTFQGGAQPTPTATRKFGATLQKAASEPEAEFGPGVTNANASALPD